MAPYYKPTNPDSCLLQAHVDQPERALRSDRQIDGFPSIFVSWLVKCLKSAVRWSVFRISRWRQRRNAIRQLQSLNDHYLKDIGLDRFQIESAVEKTMEAGSQPVWRHAPSLHGDRIGLNSHEIPGETISAADE